MSCIHSLFNIRLLPRDLLKKILLPQDNYAHFQSISVRNPFLAELVPSFLLFSHSFCLIGSGKASFLGKTNSDLSKSSKSHSQSHSLSTLSHALALSHFPSMTS